MLIYFPKQKVLYLGDLMLSESFPALENVTAYLDFLSIVLDVFPRECIFISGHGKDLTYKGLKNYFDDLNDMRQKVAKEYNNGKSVEEIIEADILGLYKAKYSQLDWLGPDAWIRRVYSYL